MDTVTGLCTFDNFLISGSKDKNLRLWSLESSICNLKHTIHSFNEYITAIEADDYLPIFYASDRSGQVKIGTVIKEKI
jgi:WD40 repeat protein